VQGCLSRPSAIPHLCILHPVERSRMPPSERVNIADLVDNSPIGRLQVRLFALCALCLIMDGFDVQALGYVAPAITEDWQIDRSQLGLVFGFGNFGVLLGALVFTMVADKVGRRPVLVWSTLFFSAMTIATARATSVEELLVLRFITGIGLGSIIPNATALIGEYSPKRSRVTLMMTITVGFTAGAALGGFVASWLIPAFGWQSVFYFGGAVPLVIGIAMLVWLPESLQFLALRAKNRERLLEWLRRLNPAAISPTAEYVVSEESRTGVPATHLFREGRTAGTLLLWLVNFMNILVLYSLASWIPTVVVGAGYTGQTAVLVGAVLQVGGTIGTFAFAWLISRHGFTRVLTTSFAVACVSIASIGPSLVSVGLLFVVVFAAGWCVIGAQPGVNALAATFYPTYMRSTGIGWGLGVGRIGAIVGPVIGGQLLARNWSDSELFYAAALPAVVSTLGMLLLHFALKKRQVTQTAAGVLAH
jgi:AAHS family 4-hydroxybenzoate transporter-like MFS transporter